MLTHSSCISPRHSSSNASNGQCSYVTSGHWQQGVCLQSLQCGQTENGCGQTARERVEAQTPEDGGKVSTKISARISADMQCKRLSSDWTTAIGSLNFTLTNALLSNLVCCHRSIPQVGPAICPHRYLTHVLTVTPRLCFVCQNGRFQQGGHAPCPIYEYS